MIRILSSQLQQYNNKLVLLIATCSMQGALFAMDAYKQQTMENARLKGESRRAALQLSAERQQYSSDDKNSVGRVRSNPSLAASRPADDTVARDLEFGMTVNYPERKIIIKNIMYGAAPYQYSCDSGKTFQESPTFENLEPREYRIVVKDATGSRTEKTVQMDPKKRTSDAENIPLHITRVASFPNMFVIKTGGGKQPYAYSCDGGDTYQDSNEFRDKAPGNYHVVVKDADGKIVDKLYTLIEFKLDEQDAHSSRDSIEQSAVDGRQTVQHSAQPNIAKQVDVRTSELAEKNNQTNGREPVLRVIESTGNLTCMIEGTGTASQPGFTIKKLSGGEPPYYVSINGGISYQEALSYDNLEQREYHIVIKDRGGNEVQLSYDATRMKTPKLLFAGLSTTQPVSRASGTLGSHKVSVSGGKPPYQYSSDGGKTYQDSPLLQNLKAGQHHVMVKDAEGTIIDKNITINAI